MLTTGLAMASTGSSSPAGCHGRAKPTNFDYLVLASIADSPRLAAMASYRPAKALRGAPDSLDRSADKRN
jgi:hypothetical protein